uniref:MPN domain containing n=1 Tax=Panthera tigris altaica TaxID=74533 RepID=A0A8C9MB38_PANTA
PGGALTRRAVTLRVLLKDALLEPGAGVLSIYYLGKKFMGDLQPDGRIVWQETGQVFNSPSAWATHCKKLVNPAKKSGCGWASVKYKGQKLDKYKAAWLRRHQLHIPTAAADEVPRPCGEEEEYSDHVPAAFSPLARPTEAVPPGKRVENKIRVPVRYCMLALALGAGENPHTLVEVTSFAAINKFQPFNVAISSNVLFLLDFHSHLTRSEVVGYLGGRWDINSQMLTVLRAFPCRSRLGDADMAATVEEEIYQSLLLRGLSLGAPQAAHRRIPGTWHRREGRSEESHRPPVPQMLLVEFYKGAPDLVRFQEPWSQEHTYLDKLKISLASRTPKDQGLCPVLEQVYSLLKQGS